MASVINREFQSWSPGHTNDYITDNCFFDRNAALTSKNKHWLAPNQDIMPDWGDMSTC